MSTRRLAGGHGVKRLQERVYPREDHAAETARCKCPVSFQGGLLWASSGIANDMPAPAEAAEAEVRAAPATRAVAFFRVDTEPRASVVLAVLCAAVLLPRAIVFPLSENLYGDAVSRTELAQRWLERPHWIANMDDGAYQYGPLHLYSLAAALGSGVVKEDAGRWVSLLFAVLSVFPLYGLTRRLFGWQAGVVAVLGFAVWGMGIQMSTTAGSEALGLFLVLWVLDLFARGVEDNRFGPLLASAAVLNLACAVRYDCWLLAPLLSVLLFLGDKDRVAAVTRGLSFLLVSMPFPMLWMQGNERARGDPFAPLHYIESFHKSWVADGIARWTEVGYRGQNLVFWPAVALLTLSPLLAAFGFWGMVHVFRTERQRRWLVWVAVLPTLYFTFRSTVLLNFVPLARFTVGQVALVFPFVYPGFEAALQGRSAAARRAWAVATVALALALPLALGFLTFRKDDGVASSLRPVSPVSTNPPAVMQVAQYLRSELLPHGGAAVLDADPMYWDLQVAFFSGLPDERLARQRWDIFRDRVASAQPHTVVRYEGGGLDHEADLRVEGATLYFAGQVFREVPGFQRPWHVYRR
jgi:4-amino-4-deoxy-L-arabinose transferase-like glycosyltransferase